MNFKQTLKKLITILLLIFIFASLPTTVSFADTESSTVSTTDKESKFKTIKPNVYNSTKPSLSDSTIKQICKDIADAFRNTKDKVDLSKYKIKYNENNTYNELAYLLYAAGREYILEGSSYSDMDINYSVTDYTNYVDCLYLKYNENHTEYLKRYNKLNNKVNEIIGKLKPSMTDLEKALYLHDYVTMNVDYSSTLGYYDSTAYEALIDHTAVCSGYANAYKLLLDRAGVKNIEVSSDNHAWNMVNINNNWYHVDTTFDRASYYDLQRKYLRHDYFLLTDEEAKESHSAWDSKGIKTPTDNEFKNYSCKGYYSAYDYFNGYVYYEDIDRNCKDECYNDIYRENIDGTNRTLIKSFDTDTSITSLSIYNNNKLYFTLRNSNKIYEINTDGSGMKVVKTIPKSIATATQTVTGTSTPGDEDDNIWLNILYIDDNGVVHYFKYIGDECLFETCKLNEKTNSTPSVSYTTHIQNKGWMDKKQDGETSGTTGQALRMEGIRINVENNTNVGVDYSAYVQGIGWEDKSSDGEISGSVGQSRRIEALKLKLTGSEAKNYDIYYRTYVQKHGWLGWSKNDEISGSMGLSLRVESVEIKIVPKDSDAPGDVSNKCIVKEPDVLYKTHVQKTGWQNYVSNGKTSGTTGKALRLEGIQIKLDSPFISGGISYRTHVQKIGWQNCVSDNALSGTTGKSLRLEAISIRLTGDIAERYDVYYRVHAQKYGWLGWAKNGANAGTAGYGLRLEGIQIKLVAKGSDAPGDTENSYIAK